MVEHATARVLLQRTLPLLVRLGDFIGNGPLDHSRSGSLGERCDLIHDIKAFLNDADDDSEGKAQP